MQNLKLSLIPKNDVENFAIELGNPKYCKLAVMSDDLKNELRNTNWEHQKMWPQDAQHMVVANTFMDPDEKQCPEHFSAYIMRCLQ